MTLIRIICTWVGVTIENRGEYHSSFQALELVAGGAVQWQKVVDERMEPLLTLEQARRIIRDVIVGLEYCKFAFCRLISPH